MSDSAATPDKPTDEPKAAKAPPAKAKPPKPEDKPFAEFVPQLLIPALAKEIESYGGPAPALELEQAAMPVVGETCWQIRGELPGDRRFWLCFTKDNIQDVCDCRVGGSAKPSGVIFD